MMNSFGEIYRLTTFGESHGAAIGGIIDGAPSDVPIDIELIQHELDRRRPGQSNITTQRRESDKVTILSGLFEGKTTGTPIGFVIPNTDQHSQDYDALRDTFRPSHADYTYFSKYHHYDYRGGGRSSARETASRIVAGSIARQILSKLGVKIYAYTSQIGKIKLNEETIVLLPDPNIIETNAVRCPNLEKADEMERLILEVKQQGDTVGGVVTGVIEGMPVGCGEPVFDKFQATLAHAMMSINAAKGFEYGMGFEGSAHLGSQINDSFYKKGNGTLGTLTNNSGGIQGGITNGEPVYFRVAFKPVATLLRDVDTCNAKGEKVQLKMKGRHDPCVVPRAVPIVEAMAAICALDAVLLNNARKFTL